VGLTRDRSGYALPSINTNDSYQGMLESNSYFVSQTN
jgi:hypothetical protein